MSKWKTRCEVSLFVATALSVLLLGAGWVAADAGLSVTGLIFGLYALWFAVVVVGLSICYVVLQTLLSVPAHKEQIRLDPDDDRVSRGLLMGTLYLRGWADRIHRRGGGRDRGREQSHSQTHTRSRSQEGQPDEYLREWTHWCMASVVILIALLVPTCASVVAAGSTGHQTASLVLPVFVRWLVILIGGLLLAALVFHTLQSVPVRAPEEEIRLSPESDRMFRDGELFTTVGMRLRARADRAYQRRHPHLHPQVYQRGRNRDEQPGDHHTDRSNPTTDSDSTSVGDCECERLTETETESESGGDHP